MTELERRLALSVVLREKWDLNGQVDAVACGVEAMAGVYGEESLVNRALRIALACTAPQLASALIALVLAVREGGDVRQAADAAGELLEKLGVPASALGRIDVIGGK